MMPPNRKNNAMSPKKLFWNSPEAEAAIAASFGRSLAVLAQSDTVWGLLVPATQEGAGQLDKIKKRRDKPYLVLMGSVKAVEKVVLFPSNGSYALAQKGWPGPLTLLLPAREGMLSDAQSPVGVVGVRVPDHAFLRKAAERYGALFSTSANISGEPVPTTLEAISESIVFGVGAIIYNNPNYISHAQPSTIVDCTGDQLTVVRQGAFVIRP